MTGISFIRLTSSAPKPKHISAEDGTPLILNRKGNYVLDQKRWDKLSDKLIAALATESKVPAPAADPSTQTSGQGGGLGASANVSAAGSQNGQRHVTFSDQKSDDETTKLIRSAFKNAGTLFQRTADTP